MQCSVGRFSSVYSQECVNSVRSSATAGGGSPPGTVYGETDDFSYHVVKDPVPVRNFHATVLHLLGFDHGRFTFRSATKDSTSV